MKTKLFTLLFALLIIQTKAQINNAKSLVNIIQAPSGSLVPDVVKDINGVVHVVYCLNQNAYYMHSTNNGSSFSIPVKVNSSGTVEYNMGERGPKLSVGIDGVVHVVWMDHWVSGAYVYARYSRSTNGGISFETMKTISATYGVDGVTMAADGNNHVCVFWHTNVPVQSAVPQATWLHTARSVNNGVTFSADTNVLINNHSGLACTMCMTRARFGADGNVYLVFRSAVGNIRDFYVLKGNPAVNNFTAIRVNTDNWFIDYCPMVGPEMEPAKRDRQVCAFMSSNHVYWAVSDSGVNAFSLHVATPLNEMDELYPTAIENNSGKVLMVWQVGPMSVTDSATVKWALYNSDGSFTGQQAVVGRTFSGTKATAFVGTDDNFYIITNADILTSIHQTAALERVTIVPNPSNDYLKISGISGKTNLTLFDMKGKLLMTKEASSNLSLDVRKLPQGEYILKLRNNDGSVAKRIVVTR